MKYSIIRYILRLLYDREIKKFMHTITNVLLDLLLLFTHDHNIGPVRLYLSIHGMGYVYQLTHIYPCLKNHCKFLTTKSKTLCYLNTAHILCGKFLFLTLRSIHFFQSHVYYFHRACTRICILPVYRKPICTVASSKKLSKNHAQSSPACLRFHLRRLEKFYHLSINPLR